LKLSQVLLVAGVLVARAEVTEWWDRRREDGAGARTRWHAIYGAQVARREGVHTRPEVRDRGATIKHRCAVEILDAVDVEKYPEGHAPLPLVWSVLVDANP
jgi:hypothetical protein